MSAFPIKPLVRPRDDGLQLSYQLPHRVYAAKSYPVLAPNGSSIIIYGYENGLKIVWRGGRPFSPLVQPPKKDQKPKPKTNGGNDDAVMVIDSDEEDNLESPGVEQPIYQFETEEPEVDPSHPYEHVIRHIDVPLGSPVLDLAVPRILPETARSSLDPFPPVLTKMIVVSAVCADYSTRVVALPLVPPHPAQTDPSTWQIQALSISGLTSHQEIPSGVSITFTCQKSDIVDESSSTEEWDLLVATHSAEASGTLLIYRIPIVESSGKETTYILPKDDVEPFQRCYLPAPAKKISFNPSSYPSLRHSSLLVAFHSGCVKIYSCFSVRPTKISRRGSISKSGVETTELEGKWLISFYPGFQKSPSGTMRRKTIVDAEWVLGGRAVIVLLADGEWGVWDIEGAGPGSVKGPLERQSSVEGVAGGSLTAYSVSGRILNPFPGSKASLEGTTVEPRPKFAPMTPSTKRTREDTFLKGSHGNSSSPSASGEISVFQTNSSRDPMPDESVLFRHGDQGAVIPSLLSLWRNAIKTTGTFDASNRCRVSTIQDVYLFGEKFKRVGYIPTASRRNREIHRRPFDVLVTAERRIIILAPKLSEPEADRAPAPAMAEVTPMETDQLRLRRGELDVDGMDRLLSGMVSAGRLQSPVKRAQPFS